MLKNKIVLIIIVFFSSCALFNDKKEKSLSEIKKEKMSIEEALDSLKLRGKNIKNFEATFNLNFKKGEDEHDLKAQIKIDRDKCIWINFVYFGISVARVYITPKKFLLFEKVGSRYIDDKLEYILKSYAPLLTYKSLENMFLGTDVTRILEGEYNIESKPYRQFLITSVKKNNKEEKSLLIYKSEIMYQKMKDNKSEISISYVGLDENFIPKKINTFLKKGKITITLNIEYINININQENVNTPFSVPEGYEKMKI